MQIEGYNFFCHSHETPLFWIFTNENFKSDQSNINIENLSSSGKYL